MSASVTVSMGEETRGALSVSFLVRGEERLTSSAVKSMKPGSKIKSLKKKFSENVKAENYELTYL